MPRIFVSQATIDHWLGAGGIVLDGDLLRFNALPQQNLFIDPAVYFERIDGSETDPYDIVGAVKSTQELAQMGADHYETSVVLGDFAYTVRPGFVAVPVAPDGTEAMLDGGGWGYLLGAMEHLGAPR
jgi:hypothetical protein